MNMKKILYILSLVFVCFFMSCEDFLDAPSQSTLEESVIFSTPGLAVSAVDGIKIPFGETNSYRGRFLTHYGNNTDIEWLNSSNSAGAKSDLCRYVNSSINTEMNTANNAWAMMYQGIERANLCIRGIRTYGNPAAGNEMGQLLGEALTLRAIYYADLLKAWGDVVARFEPVTSETTYIPKSSRDIIYKQIIADLEEAEELVDWPNANNSRTKTTEGINKAFVKAFRARLCLAAAGYSQYPDGIRRSTDPELSVATLYPIALQECKDVIESGKAGLTSTFKGFFYNVCQEINTSGGESLWELPFADGRGRMAYTYAVKHMTVDQYTGQAQGGVYGPLPNLWYDFDVKDTRRDVTCVPYFWGTADQTTKKSKQVMSEGTGSPSVNKWYFGKLRYEWMKRIVTSTNDDGLNFVYMRYAEVLLMAAEISNELTGPAAAAPYLKEIRKRAFKEVDWPAKVDAYVAALSSKELMFDAIVKEQAFEFAGEEQRKQALIRWNLLGTNMETAKTKMTNLSNQTGEYADVPSTIYFRYASDGFSLEFYGLNRGETADMSGSYSSTALYVSPTKLDQAKINSLYTNDPDSYQFWPIWQVFIDGSNNQLTNDYGY